MDVETAIQEGSARELDSLYKGSFFGKRYKLNWRAPIIVNAVLSILDVSSVMELGCGIGDLVAAFEDEGLISRGVEGTKNCLPFIECKSSQIAIWDLRKPLPFKENYDLCTCFEVAEHIEPEFADQFVANLTGVSEKLLMSIAGPGQGGHGHFNCQPMEYWEKKLYNFGYERDTSVEDLIRDGLEEYKSKPGIKAIYQNLIYFMKG